MKNEKLEVLSDHPLTPATSSMDIATSRQAQEVQGAMVIAKKFPRDETAAWDRIMKACARKTLAECACYAYPRGGTTVTGPSIRLAEALAQNWGNIDSGVIELEQRNGESSVMAFAWDLQTNSRSTKIFNVKHERKAQGVIKHLDDPRDIYELVANQGARRLRACILSIIPGDIVDAAVAECEKTLQSGGKEPLSDRARKMVAAFSDFGVTQAMIEKRIGHKMEAIGEQELVNLRKVYTSLKDGAAKREEFFDMKAATVNQSTPEHTVETDEPKNPQEPNDAPQTSGEDPFAEKTTPEMSPEEKEHAELIEKLAFLASESSISESDIVDYCKGSPKLSAKNAKTISDITTKNLKVIIGNWQLMVEKITALKK